MARIRTIKPDFWTDEKIVELSPWARLLFIGIWNFADDFGRLQYSPKRLKMQIFPADNVDVSELLGEIRGKLLVQIYEVEGVEYLSVSNFGKHQKIDKRTASKLPSPPNPPESRRIPPDNTEAPRATPSASEIPRTPPTEGKGMEGKGKEGKGVNPPVPSGTAKDPVREEIWTTGKALLEAEGMNADRAGSFLGKQVKDYGNLLVLQAVRDCATAQPIKPSEWLVARCQERRSQSGNKQAGLEARNAAAGERWLAGGGNG